MKRFTIFSILITIIILIAFFIFRNPVLNHFLNKVLQRVENSTGLNLEIEKARFSGLRTICLENIHVISTISDTIANCKKITATISLAGVVFGNSPVNNIILEDGKLRFVEVNDTVSPFAFLKKSSPESVSTQDTAMVNRNCSTLINKLWVYAVNFSQLNVRVVNSKIEWIANNYQEILIIEKFNLQNKSMNFEASHEHNENRERISGHGQLKENSKLFAISVSLGNTSKNAVPFLQKHFKIKLTADQLQGTIRRIPGKTDQSIYEISINLLSPGINHWRISDEDVVADSVHLNASISVSPNSIETVDTSVLIINKIPVHFNFLVHRSDSIHYGIDLSFENIPGDDFFSSLPETLFGTLKGIKTRGTLNYHFKFVINPAIPDSLQFVSKLSGNDFSILKFVEEDYSRIKFPFTHYVKDNNRIQRTVVVADENPYFTPLNKISPLLIHSILTSEDAAFFYHKGFSERAFRQSIATNIKEKRFARGGSTITMQLVKNVFLERNKTISRKVEEALVVWLIENNRLVSKERILEVYLNIIEWGPGIYGIGEAAEFYFSKKPWQLNLEESIYLSAIIPRPKYFRYLFEKDGTLKEYMKGYFNVVTNRLLNKDIISEDAAGKLNYHVELKGRAREIIIPLDTIPVDSLLLELPEELL